jgi:hypothetical protein
VKAAYQDKRVMVEVSSCQISTSTIRNLTLAVVVVSELATAIISYLRLTSWACTQERFVTKRLTF